MRTHYYVLDDDRRVAEVGLMDWADWMEDADRVVEITSFHGAGREMQVSTVFLGLDHNLFGSGPAQLFETMVSDNGHATCELRYATWAEAEAGHRMVVDGLMARYIKAVAA